MNEGINPPAKNIGMSKYTTITFLPYRPFFDNAYPASIELIELKTTIDNVKKIELKKDLHR
jgi:hypothetical protein